MKWGFQWKQLALGDVIIIHSSKTFISSGREFKALFISTVECVHDGFKSANPTKSFCNSYVFNTALTRAQSLVVVAGNPFLLLEVEATMPQPMGCWREYLKRCIDHIVVPEDVSANSKTVVRTLRQLIEQTEKGEITFFSVRLVF